MNINDLKTSDFSDPTVKHWAFSVMVRSIIKGVSDSEYNRGVEDAIKDPDLVHPSEVASIIAKFCTIYSRVERAGFLDDLSIESQQFAGSIARFSTNVSEFHRVRGDWNSWSSSLLDLQTRENALDIDGAVNEISELISEAAGQVGGEFSRLHLEELLRLTERVGDIGDRDPIWARRLLLRIKGRLDVISGVLSNEQDLLYIAMRVVEGIEDILSESKFVGDREKIKELEQMISLNIQANNFDRAMRESVLEGVLRLLEGFPKNSMFYLREKASLLNYDVAMGVNDKWNRGLKPSLVQYGDLYRSALMTHGAGRDKRINDIVSAANDPEADPIYNDSVKLAGLYLELSEPFSAFSKIKGHRFPLRYENAIMLEAAYRHRLGGDNPNFINKVRPSIIHAFLGDYLPARVTYEELGDAKPIEQRLGFLIDVSKRTNRPIHLEFGGGLVPGLTRTAMKEPDSISISIDPVAQFVFTEKLGFIPTSNFIMLRGRAEEAALLGANEPYADSVLIVAPQPFNIRSLLLSALLVTKPGGQIDVYSSDSLELNVLDRLGLEYTTSEFRWNEDINPPTSNISDNAQTTHIKIMVPELGDVFADSISRANEPDIESDRVVESKSFAGFFNPGIAEKGARLMLEEDGDKQSVDNLSVNIPTRSSVRGVVVPNTTVTAAAANAMPKMIK